MTPGQELDAKVAEALGWVKKPEGTVWLGDDRAVRSRWAFSTDIAVAWTLAEALVAEGHLLQIEGKQCHPGQWCVVVICEEGDDVLIHDAVADTAPHAICLAYLKAMGVEP